MKRLVVVLLGVLVVGACTAPGPPAPSSSPLSSPVSPTPNPTPSTTAPSAPPGGRCVVVDGRADAKCTPGVLNPQVTAETVRSTICVRGWTKTVRPPVSYTDRLKVQQMVAYGLTGPPSTVEEDHLTPLELGGSPTDPANLWPEPRAGSRPASMKDAQENALHRQVCDGQLSLAAAQAKILADWTHQ